LVFENQGFLNKLFCQKLIHQLFNLTRIDAAVKSRFPVDNNEWEVDFAQDSRNVWMIFHLLALHIHIRECHDIPKFFFQIISEVFCLQLYCLRRAANCCLWRRASTTTAGRHRIIATKNNGLDILHSFYSFRSLNLLHDWVPPFHRMSIARSQAAWVTSSPTLSQSAFCVTKPYLIISISGSIIISLFTDSAMVEYFLAI
jgi:hypothetical protein